MPPARMPGNTGQQIWGGRDGAPITSYHIDRERRDIDVSSEILELEPRATPFLVIGQRASRGSAKSLEVVWYDDEMEKWWTKSDDDGASGVIAAAVTSFEVPEPSMFVPNDLIKVARTGEIMLVTGIAGDEIQVERGWTRDTWTGGSQGTAAADFYTTEHATEDPDNLMRMGNAHEENSRAPEPRATQPAKYWNLVQTIRTSFSGSFDDDAEPKKAGPSERLRKQRRKAEAHKLELERSLLFGERREHYQQKRRTMGGLFQFLTDQYTSVNLNQPKIQDSEAAFEFALEAAFDHGSGSKLMLTSPRVGSLINFFARDNINTFSGEEAYGLKINRYTSFHGDLAIATSKMFERDYRDKAVILDMSNIDILPYDNKHVTLRTNLQENDRDGWKDEFMSKVTLRVRLEKTHRVLHNLLG